MGCMKDTRLTMLITLLLCVGLGTGLTYVDQYDISEELSGMGVDANANIYTTSLYHCIRALSPTFSKSTVVFGTCWTESSANDKLWEPHDVAADADGNLYIADLGNGRIMKVNELGSFVDKFEGEGCTSCIGEPSSIVVLPSGNIVYGDLVAGALVELTPSLTYVSKTDVGGLIREP